MLQKQPRLAQEKVLQAKHFLVLYTVLYGFVFVWFCTCVVCTCVVLYLYGFVFVWFVLVWFVLVWFCICMVCTCVVLYLCGLYLYGLYLYGFVFAWFYTYMVLYCFYCDHVAGRRQYSKELRMKQFSHIMKCERLRLRKKLRKLKKGIEEKFCLPYPRKLEKKGIGEETCSPYPRKQKKKGIGEETCPPCPRKLDKKGIGEETCPPCPKKRLTKEASVQEPCRRLPDRNECQIYMDKNIGKCYNLVITYLFRYI